MRRPTPRILATVLIAVALAVGLTVGALAYWTGSGDGSATTVLANIESLSFEPGTPTSQLYPGGEGGVELVVTNPNSEFVEVGSLVLDSAQGTPFATDAGHNGCNPAVLSFTTQDNDGAGWRIPPRAGSTDGTLSIDLPDALKMSTAAANACQGATFTVLLIGLPR